MALWNIVHSECADETITLGCTNNEELSALYDIHQISSIEHSFETNEVNFISKPKRICSAITNTRFVIAIDRSVLVYSDQCQNLELISSFDCDVECLCLSDDDDFLLVCCSDGYLSMLFIPMNEIVFSKSVFQTTRNQESKIFSNVAFSRKADGSTSILVFSRCGVVYQTTDIFLTDLRKAIVKKKDNLKIQEVFQKARSSIVNINCNDGILFSGFDKESFLLTMSDQIDVYCLPEMNLKVSLDKNLHSGTSPSKVKVMKNCRYAFLLDESNIIHVLCMSTFTILKTWKPFRILDFTLVEDIDDQSWVCLDVKVMVVSETENNLSLSLHKFPSFDILFSTGVTRLFHLIDVPANQDILFVEGIFDGTENVSSIAVKEITETIPEARMSRLLRKRKFDEAFLFAEAHGLAQEVIYQTKANYLLQRLDLLDKDATLATEITNMKQELFTCLDKIQDINMVANCCTNVSFNSFSETVEMFLYIINKIKNCETVDGNLKSLIFLQFRKLQTFECLFGADKFGTEWKTFKHSNFLTQLFKFLSQRNMNMVSILWSRHQRDLLESMTEEHVDTILDSIDDSLHFTIFHKWLQMSFLPVVLLEFPQCLENVLSWIINRCTIMEVVDKETWPRNAVELAVGVESLCRNVFLQSTVSSLDAQSVVAQLATNEVTNKLRRLIDNLTALTYLKTDYNCNISLNDYSQDDKKAVCYILLAMVDDANEITKFVKDFIDPFILHNRLNLSEILHDYIQEFFERESLDLWHWEETPMVKQIIALIKCIPDLEFMLRSIVCTLNCAPVPWGAQIEELANSCIDIKHPIVSVIKAEMERVVLKVVLKKYGLQHDEIHNSGDALTLINLIVVRGKENVMEDALTVIQFFPWIKDVDVYFCRMRHLISSEKFEKVVTLIHSLELRVAITCCKRLAIYTQQLLGSPLSHLTTHKESFLFVKAGVYVLGYVKKRLDPFHFVEYEELFDQLKRIRALQVEFGCFASILELNAAEHCRMTFCKNVEAFLSNGKFLFVLEESDVELFELDEKKKGSGFSETYCRLYRLAELWGLKRGTAVEIVTKLAFEQNHKDLLDILQDVCRDKMDADFADTLPSLVYYFVEHIHEKVDTMPTSFLAQFSIQLKEILSFAAPYCNFRCVEMCTILSPFLTVLQCIDEHPEEVTLGPINPYETWVFSPMYKENVLSVDAVVICSSISAIFKGMSTVLMKSHSATLESVSSVVKNGNVLIQHLSQKGRLSMALHILTVLTDMFTSYELMPRNSAMMAEVNNVRKNLACSMINVAFAQRHLDTTVLLGHLLSLDCEEARKILRDLEKRCGFNYEKLKVLAEVGCCFAGRQDFPDDVLHFKAAISLADWGKRLTEMEINPFQALPVDKMKLVPDICRLPKVTVSFLKEYCESFSLDSDRMFCILIETLLTADVSESNARFGFDSDVRDKFRLCSQAINEVQNAQLLLSSLQSVLEKVNDYNYEVLIFVSENIQLKATSLDDLETIAFSKKCIALLDFLTHYKRIEKPSDFEVGLCLERNTQPKKMDECVARRLPFHALLGFASWKIISCELTQSTIYFWLGVAPLFVGTDDREKGINNLKDKMIMSVIQSLIPQSLRRHACDESFQLMDKLFDLLSMICDPSRALAAANYIINNLPRSYLKVCAAENALSLARRWSQKTQDTKVVRAVSVFEALCTKLSSEYTLLKRGLENPNYLTLCGDPYKLIVELYKDRSIVDRYWFNSAKYPDIHEACKDIARKNDTDMDEIFFNLLEYFITPRECTAGGFEDTITSLVFSPEAAKFPIESSTIDDDNLKRAIYLMKLGSEQENGAHVAKWIFSGTCGVSQEFKYRAAQCLLHSSVDVIENCTKMTFEQFKNKVKFLFCASQLEKFHLPCESLTMRNESEVRNVIVQLLRDSCHTPKAIELAADLSLEAKITAPEIWTTILQHMMKLKMYEELSQKLISLPHNAQISSLTIVSKAWDFVLRDPNARSADKLVLFHSCPSFYELDLDSLYHSFKEMDLLVLAVDCLMHIIDPAVKEQHIANFFTVSVVKQLLKQLQELQAEFQDMFHLNEISAVVIRNISSSETIRKSLTSDEMEWIVKNTDTKD